jgi:diaminohydroxyphosphoribosylaminopyrimidine deaminase/5-amino-6-(5-phosphoribosylamino)uracil reductase
LTRTENLLLRCCNIAKSALGKQKTNPLVGSISLVDGKIMAEGWHTGFGLPHAEVEVLTQFYPRAGNHELIVTLEPCCHYGKTPPCADLIIKEGISIVHIGIQDPNPLVAGKGIEKLRNAGIEVHQYEHMDALHQLIRPFATNIKYKRPYIILKWAQSMDGFISKKEERNQLSGAMSQFHLHLIRNKIDGIFVGNNTILTDSPYLTSRIAPFSHPSKIVMDIHGRMRQLMKNNWLNENDFYFCNKSTGLATNNNKENQNTTQINIPYENYLQSWAFMLENLYEHNVGTLLVEGGAEVLSFLINHNLWDECMIIKTPVKLTKGVAAPQMLIKPSTKVQIGFDTWENYFNTDVQTHLPARSLYFPSID